MVFHKKITRRTIQIILGLLWLLDGFLQFQPQMFTSNFTSGVISPASQGQPIFVAGPMHFFIHIFLFHPAILNSFAAVTQVALGVLILWKRTTKIGLLGSIGWGLFVWAIGEGFGGLFGWHTLMLMGAPGAALIYVILAIAVFPKEAKKDKKEHQSPAYWLAFVWALFWVGGAIYQLLPGQNSISNVSAMIAGNGTGQPGWLASLDNHVSNVISSFGAHPISIANMHMTSGQMLNMRPQGQSGYWFIVLIALIQLCIGLAIFLPKIYRNIAIGLGILFSLIFWVIGQSFGGIFTGLGTDPNSAILFIVLGIAILGCNNLSKKLSSFFGRLKSEIANEFR